MFSRLAQSWAKPSTVPKPPELATILRIAAMRSSGVPITAAAPSEKAVWSTASSGDLNTGAPGLIRVPTVYSLFQCIRPLPAWARASSRVSAMCQDISTRQSLRSTLLPDFLAASSAKPHWVGRAARPASEFEPIDSTPMPYLPARVIPDGLIEEAVTIGISSCSGNSCSRASCRVNQSLLCVTRSPDSRRLITPIASSWRSRWVIGSIPSMWASDGRAPGPVPKITRPRVMWSSWTMRWVMVKGWW